MPKNEYLDAEKILGTMDSLVESGLHCPHAEPERALENMASSLLALVSEAHAGIARIRAARNMRASGAARLSQEAITTIVLFLDRFEDRLTACQVCHLWRAVALDIPAPWPEIFCTARATRVEVDRSKLVGQWNCGYCGGEVDGRFSVINSDLKRLALLRYIPGSAGLSIQLELDAECKDPFTKSLAVPMLAADVRTRALQGMQSLAGLVTREILADAFSIKDDLFLDVLDPLVASADRLSSLTIDMKCENWLSILLCLPLMPTLRCLTLTAQDVLLAPPNALQLVLLTSGLPDLPVKFPSLRYLKVCDLYVAETEQEIPHISSARIASLLRCMPKLRHLHLNLPVWPHIDAPRLANNCLSVAPQPDDDRPTLKAVVLGSNGAFYSGGTHCSSTFEELLEVLLIDGNGSIEYRVGKYSSFDAVFSVLGRREFIPTVISAILWPGIFLAKAWVHIEATNASGGRRAVRADLESDLTWNGHLIGKYLRTVHLSSLTLNIAIWNYLADGLDVHTIERLEIVIHASELYVSTPKATPMVAFKPAAPPERHRKMYLPALRTLAFGIHHSVWPKLRRDGIMDAYLNVPISVLAADIRTVSRTGTLVGNLVIGKGIRPTADAENPDADPITELRALSQSLVIL